MGGPETLQIDFYGTDPQGILLVQCTLNGTRCAVSLLSFDRLLCLRGRPVSSAGGRSPALLGGFRWDSQCAMKDCSIGTAGPYRYILDRVGWWEEHKGFASRDHRRPCRVAPGDVPRSPSQLPCGLPCGVSTFCRRLIVVRGR